MNAIDRANKAKAVLESPAFNDAFDQVRQRLMDGYEKCSLSEIDKAEDFRKCLKLLKAVRNNLEATINTGKLEAFRLEEAKKRELNPLRGIFR